MTPRQAIESIKENEIKYGIDAAVLMHTTGFTYETLISLGFPERSANEP